MEALQQKASEWSGVSLKDAFAIDDINLFEVLGGRQPFVDLTTNFYTRIYDDEDEWFRSIFDDPGDSGKAIAILDQSDFFVQRFGGPSLFSKGRGHTSLIPRHRPFPITHRAAERWLHHMQLALDDTASIDPDSRVKMMNYLRYTAYFIVAGKEMAMEGNEFPCEHATRNPAA